MQKPNTIKKFFSELRGRHLVQLSHRNCHSRDRHFVLDPVGCLHGLHWPNWPQHVASWTADSLPGSYGAWKPGLCTTKLWPKVGSLVACAATAVLPLLLLWLDQEQRTHGTAGSAIWRSCRWPWSTTSTSHSWSKPIFSTSGACATRSGFIGDS